jgi:hypothetical protein
MFPSVGWYGTEDVPPTFFSRDDKEGRLGRSSSQWQVVAVSDSESFILSFCDHGCLSIVTYLLVHRIAISGLQNNDCATPTL